MVRLEIGLPSSSWNDLLLDQIVDVFVAKMEAAKTAWL